MQASEGKAMQPLKLTIQGEYWDSQMYSGTLLLFTRDGYVQAIDWDHIIEHLEIPGELRLAAHCAFLRSDYLYGSQWELLFKDMEVKELIKSKFQRLADRDLIISDPLLTDHVLLSQESPFPFPHADTTVYRNILYSGSRSGVFWAPWHRTKQEVDLGPVEKLWDGAALSVAASYNTLALAAGDEGLFEKKIDFQEGIPSTSDPMQITDKDCVATNWVYFSVFGSSHTGEGFLADFEMTNDDQGDSQRGDERLDRRTLKNIVGAHDIFGNSGYSWGTKDKICQAGDGRVSVVGYYPWREKAEQRLCSLGTIELLPWKGQVVSGGTALFGTIIECENAIVVVPSEGEPITIPGEPVNWRVFPRSKHYENSLHIIYDDRLEIFSFNHDYFVNQKTKCSGIRFSESRRWGGR
jgi:hypothetical protein